MRKLISLTVLLATLAILPTLSQNKQRQSVTLKHGAHRIGKRTDAEMNRWREHGLGQFIHWGVYAIPGGQWKGQTSTYAAEWFRSSGLITRDEYDNLYKEFNPKKFNAKQWAKQAKEMGAKYLIFTTKHHDGFCLWPSKYTDYTVASSPYKKDIVKEIVDAYTAEGIDVHLYFSIIDWNHKGYRGGVPTTDAQKKDYETFKDFTSDQLLELLHNYPKIKGLWFDGSWDKAWIEQAPWVDKLGEELRTKHPGLIIGSRFRADENGYRHIDTNGDLIDDYDQRFERNLPKNLAEVGGNDWDCVMTVPENQWGYHRDWSLSYVKTPFDLVEMIVKANALNGNLVINFGPDGEGNIRTEETEIAKEVGKWMAINGEAIYGTHSSVLEEHNWGISTQKENNIYLTVFNKPLTNKIRVKVPRGKVETIRNEGEKETQRIFINIIENAKFLSTNNNAEVMYGGRDKNGYYYYDITVPSELQNSKMPFVIRLNMKEIDSSDKVAYQQAIT